MAYYRSDVGGGNPELYFIEENAIYSTGETEITMQSDIEILMMTQRTEGSAYYVNGYFYLESDEVKITQLATSTASNAYLIQGKKGQKYTFVDTKGNADRTPYVTRWGVK